MTRAKPLAPDERRRAIVEATTPLVLEHGAQVSTRQIADACGIAEGTLFRAFDSKDAIVHAVCTSIFDPAALIAQLDGIDRGQPLAERVREVVGISAAGAQRIRALMVVFHTGRMGEAPRRDPQADHEFMRQRHQRVTEAIARVLEPDAARLRVDPATAAAFLQMSVVAASMFPMTESLAEPAILASLVYHAITKDGPDVQ